MRHLLSSPAFLKPPFQTRAHTFLMMEAWTRILASRRWSVDRRWPSVRWRSVAHVLVVAGQFLCKKNSAMKSRRPAEKSGPKKTALLGTYPSVFISHGNLLFASPLSAAVCVGRGCETVAFALRHAPRRCKAADRFCDVHPRRITESLSANGSAIVLPSWSTSPTPG